MPGIMTHHVFGREVYAQRANVIGESGRELSAFLLGNQGPDPLFYLFMPPYTRRYSRYGHLMHTKSTAELLKAVHDCMVMPGLLLHESVDSPRAEDRVRLAEPGSSFDSEVASAVRAYGLGFLCHFLLDSTVHPLVYAQQHAICDAGLDGVSGYRAARAVHANIETELDEYVMTTHLGMTISDVLPHKVAFQCASGDLRGVSAQLASVISTVYGKPIPETLFRDAVFLNLIGQMALDSKGVGLRQRIDYMKPTGLASAYVLSLSHKNEPRPYSSFANDEHTPWPHPTKAGEVLSASFDDLYREAYEKALYQVPAFSRERLTLDQCQSITGGVNFLGR